MRDVYPAYITWEQFVTNQQTLRDNWFRSNAGPRRATTRSANAGAASATGQPSVESVAGVGAQPAVGIGP